MDILKLTKSNTREKIFQLFFSGTGRKYYLRELERILSISVGNIRRELLALEKSGLFKREKVGNLVYYFLNTDSPIFEEFKKIVAKTIGMEAILKENLAKIKDIKIAFIFGSFAKGEEDSSSDIDLMIIGKPDEDLLISKILKIEKKINREINYHIFSSADWKKKLQDKNYFVENISSYSKIFLIGDKNGLSSIN